MSAGKVCGDKDCYQRHKEASADTCTICSVALLGPYYPVEHKGRDAKVCTENKACYEEWQAPVALGAATDKSNGFTGLDGAHGVSTFTSGDGSTIAIVASAGDDGVQPRLEWLHAQKDRRRTPLPLEGVLGPDDRPAGRQLVHRLHNNTEQPSVSNRVCRSGEASRECRWQLCDSHRPAARRPAA